MGSEHSDPTSKTKFSENSMSTGISAVIFLMCNYVKTSENTMKARDSRGEI